MTENLSIRIIPPEIIDQNDDCKLCREARRSRGNNFITSLTRKNGGDPKDVGGLRSLVNFGTSWSGEGKQSYGSCPVQKDVDVQPCEHVKNSIQAYLEEGRTQLLVSVETERNIDFGTLCYSAVAETVQRLTYFV
jgi:hypothetical protein